MGESATDTHDAALPVQRPSRLVRLVAVIVSLIAWHASQALIGPARKLVFGTAETPQRVGTAAIGDGLHQLSANCNAYLIAEPSWANLLLLASSGVIDLLGIFLLGMSILGSSIRPFLGLLILFGLRQVCQILCTLPPPDGMIWRDPGCPSLLVTYGVATDLFFSGHTAIAVYGAIELSRLGRWFAALGITLALFEATTVLVLRAHYTMDVFAGAMTALFVAGLAARLAPNCDRSLIRLRKG